MTQHIVSPTLFVILSLQIFAGIAPETRSTPSVVHLVAGEEFLVKCVDELLPPVWVVDDEALINTTQLPRTAEVERGYESTAGGYWATLTIADVTSLNGSRILCRSVNGTILITPLTLVVGNKTTVIWLRINETFSSHVCTSPSVDSLPPRWLIDGVLLGSISINMMYGAQVKVLSDDHLGRHQSRLLIKSVNTSLNITCMVGTELRRQFTIYIVPPGTPATDVVTTSMVVSDVATAGGADVAIRIAIAVSVVAVLVILLPIIVIVIVIFMCVSKKIRAMVCRSRIWQAACGRYLNGNGNRLASTPDNGEKPPCSTRAQEDTSSSTPVHPKPTIDQGRRRLIMPKDSVQRDGVHVPVEAPAVPISKDDVQLLSGYVENVLPEAAVSCGVPEESQGQGYGVIAVCGQGTFEYQTLSCGPSKTFVLTKPEMLEKGFVEDVEP